jgi:hypothetical protein
VHKTPRSYVEISNPGRFQVPVGFELMVDGDLPRFFPPLPLFLKKWSAKNSDRPWVIKILVYNKIYIVFCRRMKEDTQNS